MGLVMIPSGLGTMMGSVVGGRVADRAARGRSVDYRLIPTTYGSVCSTRALVRDGESKTAFRSPLVDPNADWDSWRLCRALFCWAG